MNIQTKKTRPRGHGRIDTTTPRKAALNVTLPNSVSVPAPFYDDVRKRIQQNRSEFENFNLLVLQDVLGIDAWSEYSDTQKQAASACVAYLYETDQLPLELFDFELQNAGGCALKLTR